MLYSKLFYFKINLKLKNLLNYLYFKFNIIELIKFII